MERGSVVDAQIDYLDNNVMSIRYLRMHNHYIHGWLTLTRDFEREEKEDNYNEKLNREWRTKLLDHQRK
jgi:hypothetical protein